MTLNNKNGFAFSIFALFIAFIIFAFGSLYLFEASYTKNSDFSSARIHFLNEEVEYFKNSYLDNALSYSAYNVLFALLNYSRDNYNFDKDYPKLTSLIKEGMINGTFDGVPQSLLIGKNVTYLVGLFQNDFENNFQGNFSHEILEIVIFEEVPYYISLQVISSYNITTVDNISSWNFIDETTVKVPVFDIPDPEFLLQENLSIDVRPSEYYLIGHQNWTNDTLKIALDGVYSTVFKDSHYDYTIGTSFLNRLLNISLTSYNQTLGYWTFDKDEDYLGVYDNTQINNLSYHYGNSLVLFSFDNSSTSLTSTNDSTAYNNDALFNGNVICGVEGVNLEACEFDGLASYINITNRDKFNFGFDDFSVCLWFKANTLYNNDNNNSQLFVKRVSNRGNYEMQIENSKLRVYFDGNYSDGSYGHYFIDSEDNLTIDTWYHSCITRSNGIGKLYLNAQLEGKIENLDFNVSSDSDLILGFDSVRSPLTTQESFNGTIDEFGLYSKALSDKEIAKLYASEKAIPLDYVDSLHTKGVSLDGIDDLILINTSNKLDFETYDFTACTWFKPNELKATSGTLSRQELLKKRGPTGGGFGIQLVNETLNGYIVNVSGSESNLTTLTSLLPNLWYYSCLVKEDTWIYLYLNGNLENSLDFNQTYNISAPDFKLYVGHDNYSASGEFFNGTIDEIKIYNRSLTALEINMHYFNYESTSKGCCNYLTLINPNLMNYNRTSYGDNENISYSSKLFYDYYKRNKPAGSDITLFNITDFTSTEVDEEYYNLRFDVCLMQAFNVFDPQVDPDPQIYYPGSDGINCSYLIRQGYY